MTDRWWDDAVGYEVYIRSFQDSDGDGVGDLPGIRRRLDHLADLGVDIVWVTPFYPSPGADHGYDVADYVGVDPRFGGLDDVDALVEAAHSRGMRVVVDIVPNHSSDQHPWFQSALGDRSSPYRDHYVWRDPAPDGGPPNNWVSHFGGPAWTLDEATGQYYLHLFLPEQPDLNWSNPRLREAFDDVLRFWLDRGVDGFRIDVAHAMVHDPEYRDNPLIAEEPPPPDAHPSRAFDAYDHLYDQDRPEVLDIYRRWRRIADEHDAVLIGEVYLLEPAALARYVADGDGLHTAFAFAALRTAWDADDIRSTLQAALDALDAAGGPGRGSLSWPLSSHDDPRAAERFGGGEVGAQRALAYWTLLCGLPGIPFLFQGDELGLDDGRIDLSASADPIARRNPGQRGRDGSRTPMIWEDTDGFGFTTGTPWLPFGTNRSGARTVAAQRGRDGSHLERMRTLLSVRRKLDDLTGDAPLTWLDAPPGVVAFRRGDTIVALNTADPDRTLPLPGAPRLVFASADGATVGDESVVVPADAALIATLT